ncbi:MAG: glycosyltransferase family 2 protein [Pirellulales bacterium]|nr:glycosyltransferase family 2 protein [Pirellulales bacterium]
MYQDNSNTALPSDAPRFLTALPVFNEAGHVTQVLDEVVKYAADVLVVDDGSTDGTRELLAQRKDIDVVLHPQNRGYGAALRTAFQYAIVRRYDVIVTIDCDGQHEPQRIVQFAAGCQEGDIISGSRYLDLSQSLENVPEDRRRINQQITAELNDKLGLNLTDAFCGFKAYCTRAIAQLSLTENGYAMPLELWVQAAQHALKIIERPVPLIYLDEKRSFGDALDTADTRLKYYREVIRQAREKTSRYPSLQSSPAVSDADAQPCS